MGRNASGDLSPKALAVLAVIAIGVTVAVSVHDRKHHPRLAAFGEREWHTTCEGARRPYRLHAYNYRNSQGNRSIHRRALTLEDAAGTKRHQTRAFDSEALDRDGVWRWSLGSPDPRLFAPKNPAAVLDGDEVRLDVAADLRALTVWRRGGAADVYACVPERT